MSVKKRNTKRNREFPSEEEVYRFMLKCAEEFRDETDVVEAGFCQHTREFDYALKLVREKDGLEEIYSLYACDKDGEHHFGKPFVSGSLNKVIAYLKDRDNTDVVMLSVYKKH